VDGSSGIVLTFGFGVHRLEGPSERVADGGQRRWRDPCPFPPANRPLGRLILRMSENEQRFLSGPPLRCGPQGKGRESVSLRNVGRGDVPTGHGGSARADAVEKEEAIHGG
jgi:hypothetical protein